jgi:hypothetical protein
LPARSRGGADGVERAWVRLISNLQAAECVPFLGAGACAGNIPLGGAMAQTWAERHKYPMRDKDNLARVMQYIATVEYGGDATSLKREFVGLEFKALSPPDYRDPKQVHGQLARFDLPLYVTTNYDDLMYGALQHWGRRPRPAHSLWYPTADPKASPLSDRSYEPSQAEPLIFHLHGHHRTPESLVLTEDDYIEYLVQLAGEKDLVAGDGSGLLPPYVRGLLRSKSLLFVGYSLRDWTFLVLFRTLLHGIPLTHRRNHVSVQIDPKERAASRTRAYLKEYLGSQRIEIFWNSADEFADELNERLRGV